MHELSIAIGLIDLAVEEAGAQGGVKVAALHVRVGRLAGIDVIELSARTSNEFDAWIAWLRERVSATRVRMESAIALGS